VRVREAFESKRGNEETKKRGTYLSWLKTDNQPTQPTASIILTASTNHQRWIVASAILRMPWNGPNPPWPGCRKSLLVENERQEDPKLFRGFAFAEHTGRPNEEL